MCLFSRRVSSRSGFFFFFFFLDDIATCVIQKAEQSKQVRNKCVQYTAWVEVEIREWWYRKELGTVLEKLLLCLLRRWSFGWVDLGGSDKRSALRVESDSTGAVLGEEAVEGFADPEDGEDAEGKGRPVNERRGALMIKDTEDGPGNGDATGKISFGGGESVGGRSGLKEQERKEDEDVGEDTGVVTVSVHAKGLESGDEDEESRESVPEGEGEVDPKFIVDVLGGVMLLDNVVDVRGGRADEQGKDESNDIVAARPDVDVDGVEDDEQGEAPVDGVNDNLLAGFEELVDDGAEEKEVDNGPDAEGPSSGSEVRLLASAVVVVGTSDGVDVTTGEEEVDDNVHDFEEDAFCPLCHCLSVVI